MDKKNRLVLAMGIFYMIVILSFGLIIINEKKKDMLIPKVEKEIDKYIEEKYESEKDTFKFSKIKRLDDKYTMKVSNKTNSDLYFTINYINNKITDTYKEDYVEGKSINNSITIYLNNLLEEKVKTNKNTYTEYKIVYNTKLSNCTSYVKKKLLDKKYNIPIYTIYVETNYSDDLKSVIEEIISYTKKLKFNPKNYHIILNNTKNISKSLDITIPNDIEDLDTIVKLINENKLKELEEYNVKCKYLN